MSAQPQHFLGAASNDADPQETKEWLDALSAVIDREGAERAHFLIEEMLEHARQHSIDLPLIAEQVETEGAWMTLRALGFEGGQGRLLGNPAPLQGNAN